MPVRRSGVRYGNPVFEWILTARWAGYTFAEFEKLPTDRQALLIAARRTEQRIEAVLAYRDRPRKK